MDIQVGIAGCAERPMSMALAVCRKWVSRNSAQVQTTWLSCASEITQAEAVCFGNLSSAPVLVDTDDDVTVLL